jgi:hypothetical protein
MSMENVEAVVIGEARVGGEKGILFVRLYVFIIHLYIYVCIHIYICVNIYVCMFVCIY